MKSWIFQGNPDRFDVNEYLRRGSLIYWTVSLPVHQRKVAVGDFVFIWRAKGRTDMTAGVVATGRIVEPCKPRAEIANAELISDDLWRPGQRVPGEIKAGIALEEVRLAPAEGMLTLADIRQDELLSKMRIVTVRSGSNFPLPESHARKLSALWESARSITEEEIYRDAEYIAREGRVREAIHRSRERNRRLISEAKNIFNSRNGRLFCELCNFSFEETYGSMGRGFIEAHHLKAVSELQEGEETRVQDLMMVCSNCHRMIHSGDHRENLRLIRERLS